MLVTFGVIAPLPVVAQYPVSALTVETVKLAVPLEQIVWFAPTLTEGTPLNTFTVIVNGVPVQVKPAFVYCGVTV